MANFITIFRVFLMFIGVYLVMTQEGNFNAYVWALVLTILAFSLDGLDGYVARKFHEESKLGALLDIMSDRIVENTYWIVFAVMGWLPVWFSLVALTRGFVTDTIRSAAMEKGLTPFGMQRNPICKWITGSKFMRITYAVAKVLAFIVIIAAKVPNIPNADVVYHVGYLLALIAIVFCVVRGLPVVIEAKAVLGDEQ
ncbi:TPA: CDP-alcohol phosphatidyltransferase [Candidatus Gastranaerophilales bacterium HUM_9]|nr:MAG TPA: CDP-alcohol phosphatidyltransferase [Candidatus Gastranaerophilales bacterium HUM_9]HBX34714.1 CDP-alcohol phosphatidyltransferase family protein [Cyanobacteria bacterium UBA11440]